ncbi:hypothetical protein [Xanthomonas prunicola]|uniref:Uncharacterized protein n=1 Tax=Xanthomonas prunicola TaxID=2053930 RepID=A0A9Q9IYV1_9XANT|nr:hypothetical protein [Xanthomonas prunicola]UXA66047.1 hypothetical protein M0D43_03100 [Xanthomonas prunicola]
MGFNKQQLEAMARQVAAGMGIETTGTPRRLTVVGSEHHSNAGRLNALQRDVIYSRIRDLGNMYWLKWLIRQETMHVFGIMESLSDDELNALLKKMERARECREEGIGFDEVPGLVKGSVSVY